MRRTTPSKSSSVKPSDQIGREGGREEGGEGGRDGGRERQRDRLTETERDRCRQRGTETDRDRDPRSRRAGCAAAYHLCCGNVPFVLWQRTIRVVFSLALPWGMHMSESVRMHKHTFARESACAFTSEHARERAQYAPAVPPASALFFYEFPRICKQEGVAQACEWCPRCMPRAWLPLL